MQLTWDVYKDCQAAGREVGIFPIPHNLRVLEIGFGRGNLLKALRDNGNEVHGIDISENLVRDIKAEGFENIHFMDISESSLPYPDDFFDVIYCYEVFEHLTNPHRLFYEVRRTLKKGHYLFFSVPAQENDMGYARGRHAFVYPGLMEKENMCRFITQMYFRIDKAIEPGPHEYLKGYNYALCNMKEPDRPDIIEVVSKDYNVEDLYGYILTDDELDKEMAREIDPQLQMLSIYLLGGNLDEASDLITYLLDLYPEYLSLYPSILCILIKTGYQDSATEFVDTICNPRNLPKEVMDVINDLIAEKNL